MPGKDYAMKNLSFAIASTALLAGSVFAAAQGAKLPVGEKPDTISSDVAATTYSFTEVNYKGDTFTQLLAINNNNVIAGYHGSGLDPANPNKGFTYTTAGGFVSQNYPGSAQTQVIGINDSNDASGFWVDAKGNNYSWYQAGGLFRSPTFPGTKFNQFLSFNNNGEAAGYSQDSAGNFHPYVWNRANIYASYLLPTAVSAQATGKNNIGAIVGFFIDSKNLTHGFQLYNGVFHEFDFPGATSTQCLGTNDSNEVVGTYTDTSNNVHGFYWKATVYTSLDDPNGIGSTIINGINNAGILVGFWGNTGAGISHGFIATPKL